MSYENSFRSSCQEGDNVHFIHHNVDTYGSITAIIGDLLMIQTNRGEVVSKYYDDICGMRDDLDD